MYNIFTRWFEHFQKKGAKIPPNFDVHIIINVMVILFNSQHALGITSALNFWYAFSGLFQLEVNIYFLKIFVRYFFFKIFLHWSSNVRESLGYFLCYRVLYLFEQNKDSPDLERLCLRINRFLNVVARIGEQYSLERLRWENRSKAQRRRETLDALKAKIVVDVQRLPAEKLRENFFVDSRKFSEAHERRRKSSEGSPFPGSGNRLGSEEFKALEDDNFDQSLLSIKDSKINLKMVKLRDYRVKLSSNSKKKHHALIKAKNVSYCQTALSDFRKILDRFYMIYNAEGAISAENLPKLSLKILIDEFEFIDTDEYEW